VNKVETKVQLFKPTGIQIQCSETRHNRQRAMQMFVHEIELKKQRSVLTSEDEN
jgi:protein subunit release factor B